MKEFIYHNAVNLYYKKQEIGILKRNIEIIQKDIDATGKFLNLQNKINKRIDELLNQ